MPMIDLDTVSIVIITILIVMSVLFIIGIFYFKVDSDDLGIYTSVFIIATIALTTLIMLPFSIIKSKNDFQNYCASIALNKNNMFISMQESFNTNNFQDTKILQMINNQKNEINNNITNLNEIGAFREGAIVSTQNSLEKVWQNFLQIKNKDDYRFVVLAMDDLNTNIARICPDNN